MFFKKIFSTLLSFCPLSLLMLALVIVSTAWAVGTVLRQGVTTLQAPWCSLHPGRDTTPDVWYQSGLQPILSPRGLSTLPLSFQMQDKN